MPEVVIRSGMVKKREVPRLTLVVIQLTMTMAKPELLYPEAMSSSSFFLFGVPNEQSLLAGVEVKAASQTLKKGLFTLV
jgi:hypothetical protein